MSTKFSVLKELFMDLYNPVGSYDYFKNLLLSLIKEVNKCCFLIIHESYLSWVSDPQKPCPAVIQDVTLFKNSVLAGVIHHRS